MKFKFSGFKAMINPIYNIIFNVIERRRKVRLNWHRCLVILPRAIHCGCSLNGEYEYIFMCMAERRLTIKGWQYREIEK